MAWLFPPVFTWTHLSAQEEERKINKRSSNVKEISYGFGSAWLSRLEQDKIDSQETPSLGQNSQVTSGGDSWVRPSSPQILSPPPFFFSRDDGKREAKISKSSIMFYPLTMLRVCDGWELYLQSWRNLDSNPKSSSSSKLITVWLYIYWRIALSLRFISTSIKWAQQYLLLLEKKYVFIYLAVLDISCGIWDLVPQPGMESQAPSFGGMES